MGKWVNKRGNRYINLINSHEIKDLDFPRSNLQWKKNQIQNKYKDYDAVLVEQWPPNP